eukprot:TRINITY_DN1277_c0_g1_i1.p1 TRINITY_DN1277_c0_g1~~TRINITY_DN1277_c0_g1_i1.p1  ORF type:complete len:776 (+),score=33.72 TRINITY_DN1277_c0_g1_i1:4062-6389(+)
MPLSISPIYNIRRAQCRKSPDEPLAIIIGEEGVTTKSREELRLMGECLAKSLEDFDLCPKIDVDGVKMRTLGILIHNCWMSPVLMYATLYQCCAGNIIYTDPPDHYYYNMNHGLFDTVMLSTPMIEIFLKPLENKEIRIVKNLILENNAPAEYVQRFKNYGINIYYFNDLIEKGKNSNTKLERPTPETHTYVVSTSGSTGCPKGAVILDKNLFMNTVLECGPWHDNLANDSYMLNNLTLGFGTVLGFNILMLTKGGKLVYLEKKCDNFFEELKTGDPTFLVLSPLAYNKMYQVIQNVIHGLPEEKKQGLMKVLDMKTRYYRVTRKCSHPAFDKLLEPFRKQFFGDRLKLLVNVGAAINEEVFTFFKVLTGRKMINAYGSCEMGGLCMTSSDTDPAEVVGLPLPWYEIKLVDVPEKNYFTTDTLEGKPCPRGEIWVRGPMMHRYLSEPKKTSETITPDGWLKTGDIAMFKEGTVMQIIDRKNQVVKLTCAEFLAIERVENMYKASPFVSQICVYADHTRDYGVAIVVPNVPKLLEVAKQKGLTQEVAELCEMPEMEKVVVDDFKAMGDAKRVLYFEYLPRVILVPEPFTQANGLVTVTYKVRRVEVAKKYADRIEAVYKDKNVKWIHQSRRIGELRVLFIYLPIWFIDYCKICLYFIIYYSLHPSYAKYQQQQRVSINEQISYFCINTTQKQNGKGSRRGDSELLHIQPRTNVHSRVPYIIAVQQQGRITGSRFQQQILLLSFIPLVYIFVQMQQRALLSVLLRCSIAQTSLPWWG